MIKFFRKIRQQLLKENRFSKYLLYAVGEIVLVVIGILIALAINNSSQARELRQKEQTYLTGLKDEFETSRVKLEELIRVNRSNLEGAREIIGYIEKRELTGEAQFSQLLFKTFSSDVSFNPNNSLLTEMINSGSLKDISNTRLRAKLTNWVSTIEDISKQENELGVQRERTIDIFRTNDRSLKKVFDLAGVSNDLGLPMGSNDISNLELLNSNEFENNVLMFMLTSYATENAHYMPLLADLDTILVLIDEELTKS